MLRKATITATIITGLIIAGTGTAVAYWTTGGHGTGTATVGTAKNLIITQTPVTGLIPGRPAALAGIIGNPSSFDVNLTHQALTVIPTIDRKHSKCRVDANFRFVAPRILDMVVKAGGTARFGGGSIMLLNLPKVDQWVCQGATVTLDYQLNGGALHA